MAAVAEKTEKRSLVDDVATALMDGDMPVKELLGLVSEQALAIAWGRGDVEFGRTKYVVTGNPSNPIDNHNGVVQARPSVIVEGGTEWSGPKKRYHGPAKSIIGETLPEAVRYQKYQHEVCVNKEKDVWEWLEGNANGRETRYARRDIQRPEAEALFQLRVRLTEKGMGIL